MKQKKESKMTVEEFSFEMALRTAGYNLSTEAVKISYRLAILCQEKKEQVSLKDIAIVQGDVIEESKVGEQAS
jgi:hypothetical protein